jgi:methionyl-tRNA formyltransferase
MKNIIATLHGKNIENFRKLNPEEWILIQDKESLNLKIMNEINPRYIFFPVWHWRIPEEIWRKYECVVFHMTDLPFGRGASPYENLIARGIYDTKVSALRAEAEYDAGPIYMKRDFRLSNSKEDTLIRVSDLIFDTMIPYIIKNNPIPVPQVGKPTYFKRIK